MCGSNAVSTPMAIKNHISDDSTAFPNPQLYRSIVGGLQYLTMTRPSLSFSGNSVYQNMQSLTVGHFQAVKRILHYLSGTMNVGLRILFRSTVELYGFSVQIGPNALLLNHRILYIPWRKLDFLVYKDATYCLSLLH